MRITRGSENHKVTFGTLRGGEKFLGSVTGRKFIKLARPSRDGKNCATVEGGQLRKVSDDDTVERVGSYRVPFHTLQEGQLFRGTQTPSIFKKTAKMTRGDGKKSNAVRLGKMADCAQYYYLKDTMVEPVEGSLEVVGR